MTIEINKPEIEALILERLKTGNFTDPRDVILHALRTSLSPKRTPADLLTALRASPSEDAAKAPAWLQESWANARESGLDLMTMDEIDAEIAAARLERHHLTEPPSA